MKKILLPLLLFAVIIFLSLVIYRQLYNSVFRLSKTDVQIMLSKSNQTCKKIMDCDLAPGDILIRRYVTPTTKEFNSILHPYFTHVAFYEGEGKIVEAIGRQKKHEDEIRTAELANTDWTDNKIESVVVIRPNYNHDELSKVITNLRSISKDNNYRFGFSQINKNYTSCAEMVMNQLELIGMKNTKNLPNLITPDYLFWSSLKSADEYRVITYYFN